jgi:hypothetical protein
MNLSRLECKENNAVYVKRMMPDAVLLFLCLASTSAHRKGHRY